MHRLNGQTRRNGIRRRHYSCVGPWRRAALAEDLAQSLSISLADVFSSPTEHGSILAYELAIFEVDGCTFGMESMRLGSSTSSMVWARKMARISSAQGGSVTGLTTVSRLPRSASWATVKARKTQTANGTAA